jgi:hypothetical protein
LPLSRRFIFAVMFAPYVLLMGVGYAGGRIVADRAESATELIKYVEHDGHYRLSVPLRNGAIALDGDPEPVSAPWGEAHEMWSAPIFSGAVPVVHARFSTPPGSSADYVAWQMSRAIREIYGEDVQWRSLRDRYLTRDETGRVVPVGGRLTLAADHQEWSVMSYGPVFPVMMLIVCGLWFGAMSLYLRTLRPGFTEKQRKGAFWIGMVVLMGLHLSQFGAVFTEKLDHWVLSGTSMIAIRELSGRMPGGAIGVWIACALAFYAVYRTAESQFTRVESKPGDDMRVALIERPIGAASEEGAYAR